VLLPATGVLRRAPRTPTDRLRAVGHALGTSVVLIAVAALLALAVGPHVFGYRTVTMRTGSMRPVVGPGDVVVIRSEPVTAVRPGQLITFAAPVPGSPVLTHRVVTVDHQATGTVVTTKGDANPAPDPWLARLEGDTAWHVVAVVPAVGWAIAWLHRPLVRVLSVWLLPAWLCAEALIWLWRGPRARSGVRRSPLDGEPAR
jgi:signal peptidase I